MHLRWICSSTYFCFEQDDIYRDGLFPPEINTWHPYWTNTLWHTWEFTNTALYRRINTSRFRITKMQIMLHIEDTPKMSLTCHFIHPFSHGLLLSMYSIWLSIIQQFDIWGWSWQYEYISLYWSSFDSCGYCTRPPPPLYNIRYHHLRPGL